MDGNRRWATKQKLEKKEGHIFGYKALERSLEWYNQLGIEQVTVFTFSIENYKRPAAEVNTIMKLACEKFDEMVLKKSTIEKNQCKIQIMGNVSLLPEQVRRSVFNVVKMTSQHTKVKLNMCFSYTSTDEISQALETVIQNCSPPSSSIPPQQQQQQETKQPNSSNSSSSPASSSSPSISSSISSQSSNNTAPNITLDDVTPSLLSSCMYCPDDPDIVIRTSGETRLSEFLLWQSASTVLNFLSVLWPDFSVWHLCTSILLYQYSYPEIQKRKQLFKQLEEQYTNSTANPSEERTAKFVNWKRDVEFNTLKPKVQS